MRKGTESRDKNSPNLYSLQPDRLKRLFRKHLQGAFVRSGASLFMWLFVLISFFYDTIHLDTFKGVSASVSFLILMNVPTLWVLRSITKRQLYRYFSLFIHLLEIMGYTAVLYFLGGIRATFMLPIYTALIWNSPAWSLERPPKALEKRISN